MSEIIENENTLDTEIITEPKKLTSYRKWQLKNKDHLNEYGRKRYKNNIEKEEWKKNNREQVKENMRRYRIKLYEERAATGWTPQKRGPKPKTKLCEIKPETTNEKSCDDL
jgi:hypothetical protein